MSIDWNTFGQIGIVLEMVGAAIIVYGAWKARREVAGLTGLFDDATESIEALLAAVRDQFSRELTGFSLLAAGLAMQFAGGFAR